MAPQDPNDFDQSLNEDRIQEPLRGLLNNSEGDNITSHRRQGDDTHCRGDSEPNKRDSLSKRTFSGMSERFIENVYYVKDSRTVSRLSVARRWIGKTVNDNRVQGFILALIVINAIMMGIATYPVVKDNPNVSSKFELIDQIFLIIFTIEAALQITYRGLTLFKDAWLVFDVTIVAISWAFDTVQVARAFRVFRALRLIARVDVMRNLIKALVGVIPNVTAIVMLLFLVFYIFAVMFTQLYKEESKQYEREEQYFVALPETFFTLFQIMTMVSNLPITLHNICLMVLSQKTTKPSICRTSGVEYSSKHMKCITGRGSHSFLLSLYQHSFLQI
jgi:hypothetical protein